MQIIISVEKSLESQKKTTHKKYFLIRLNHKEIPITYMQFVGLLIRNIQTM